MHYIHSMIRTLDLDATMDFFKLLGFCETRTIESQEGRYTLVFMAPPGEALEIEITFNWDQTDTYGSGRAFGHLAYMVDDIYALCQKLVDAGVTINRPPRDGKMAFIRTPDGVSLELVQDGQLEPAEPWLSMSNIGSW
ncbi:VOC family protein [Sphingobium aquiterrae]|uniref:VOC family protein n=1 Tax=Sphingobium aquiterrae TaxID=2038656 RepID=UPI003018CA63